jgi:GntR family transcriptional regulator/MocR family aminotransferase
MRAVYATRQKNLVKLINKHLSRFVSLEIPVGGLQMPLKLTRHLSERAVVDSAMSIGIDLLGMSDLDMVGDVHPGFFDGFCRIHRKRDGRRNKKISEKVPITRLLNRVLSLIKC